MYKTKAGKRMNGNGWESQIAHPMSRKRKPTYMGFRLARYTPDVTTDEAASGVMGLKVVLAFWNSYSPANMKRMPTAKIIAARPCRQGKVKASDGSCHATNHIPPASTSTRANGGTLSSRSFKKLIP